MKVLVLLYNVSYYLHNVEEFVSHLIKQEHAAWDSHDTILTLLKFVWTKPVFRCRSARFIKSRLNLLNCIFLYNKPPFESSQIFDLTYIMYSASSLTEWFCMLQLEYLRRPQFWWCYQPYWLLQLTYVWPAWLRISPLVWDHLMLSPLLIVFFHHQQ